MKRVISRPYKWEGHDKMSCLKGRVILVYASGVVELCWYTVYLKQILMVLYIWFNYQFRVLKSYDATHVSTPPSSFNF